MRKITLAGLVAVVAVLLIAPAAYATPSMSVTDIVSPFGHYHDNPGQPTTWNVSLSGISAWDTSDCSSTAHFADAQGVGEDLDGEDAGGEDWRYWQFTVPTPWGTTINYDRLRYVHATCVLEKKRYFGRRPYRSAFWREKSGASAYRQSGCPIYSYSVGKLTIDCRHSSNTGYASWRFPLRRSDIVRQARAYFDRSQSTIGAHNTRYVRWPRSLVLTESVSPGTMITITGVDVNISRRYWRAAYLKQKKTLRASWYATYQWDLEHGG
jgi:hypothetical protein